MKRTSVLLCCILVIVGTDPHSSPIKSLRHWLNFFKSKHAQNKDLKALTELKKVSSRTIEGPILEGSISSEANIVLPYFLQQRQDNFNCTCIPTPNCTVSCESLESTCGQTCTHLTVFSATSYRRGHTRFTLKSVDIFTNGCEALQTACTSSLPIAAAAAVAAIAIALAVGVPVGIQAANALQNSQQSEQISQQVGEFIASGGLLDNQTPVNNLPIPVDGSSLRNDGCGDNSVRYSDGICYPVLRRGPCNDPLQWITVDPLSLAARCSPRLCGKGRVFVGRDGLCHDISDPSECQGGRRLYYTAYGDPLCDCPIGQYPFPTPEDDCVPLFQRGPCPAGQVVAINPSGLLGCTPSECQLLDNRQLVPTGDGFCNDLGSQCPRGLLGYDVFGGRATCVDVANPDSPYFSSQQDEDLLDNFYNQMYPEYDQYRIRLLLDRKQDANSIGVFQIPATVLNPDPLLNPCRPGARNGNNYKCVNPLVTNRRRKRLLQAVRSAFRCPEDSILQATGQCGNDSRAASCGPSYQYIEASGQCRPIVQTNR